MGAATRIVLRTANKATRAAPDTRVLAHVRISDQDIDRTILERVLDEDNLGTGSNADDLARRSEIATPNRSKPEGGRGADVEDVGPDRKVTRLADDTVRVQRGRNEKTTVFDPHTGRPVSENGTIRQDFGSTPRGDNATAVGRLGEPGDHGGHLGAHRFYGDTPDEGIAPQAGNLNTGAWKTMENEWADWTKLGYEVDYQIDVYPPGAVRPDVFRADYRVVDPQTGKIVYRGRPRFRNSTGQSFNRINWRDMQTNYGKN